MKKPYKAPSVTTHTRPGLSHLFWALRAEIEEKVPRESRTVLLNLIAAAEDFVQQSESMNPRTRR